MTAYARAKLKVPQGEWLLELHTVNRKGLDLNIQLPSNYLHLDIDVRKFFLDKVVRGQLTVRLSFMAGSQEFQDAQLETLKILQKKWNGLALELGYPPKEAVTFAFLTEEAGRSSSTVPDLISFETLRPLFVEGVSALLQMKEREGELLEKTLAQHLEKIRVFVEMLTVRVPEVLSHYKLRLEEKLKEFASMVDSQERILRELSFFAEKSDITEELARLSSHLIQFDERLGGKEKSAGKLLDFLLQEMAREANTICSKSVDALMTHVAIEVKGEIEKVREQVQNIE